MNNHTQRIYNQMRAEIVSELSGQNGTPLLNPDGVVVSSLLKAIANAIARETGH